MVHYVLDLVVLDLIVTPSARPLLRLLLGRRVVLAVVVVENEIAAALLLPRRLLYIYPAP